MPLRGEGSDRGPVLMSFKNRRGAEFFRSPAVLRQNAENAVFPAHAPGAASRIARGHGDRKARRWGIRRPKSAPVGDAKVEKHAGRGRGGRKACRWGNTEAGAVSRQPEDWFIFMNVSVRKPSRPFAEPLYCRENVVPEGAATKKAAVPFAVEPLAAVAKYTLTPRFGVPL